MNESSTPDADSPGEDATVYDQELAELLSLAEDALQRGEVVELDSIDTLANTLAPRKSEAINLALIQDNVDDIVLVTDEQMRDAARWLWREFGLGVELSAAAAVAALQARAYVPNENAVCTALVCGAGSDGMS